jgi:hypothetical protein
MLLFETAAGGERAHLFQWPATEVQFQFKIFAVSYSILRYAPTAGDDWSEAGDEPDTLDEDLDPEDLDPEDLEPEDREVVLDRDPAADAAGDTAGDTAGG